MTNTYRTTDLSTAAFLLISEASFKGLEARDHRSKWFLFHPRKRCEKLVADFISGKARVRARDYADSMRRAKDIIFSAERSA